MAKIFVAFFNGVYDPNNTNIISCFYESFLNGLVDAGNDVIKFATDQFTYLFDIPVPSGLLENIKQFNPDLIILFNNKFYDLSEHFDCPIIIYEIDSMLYFSNIENIKKNPDRYKFIVSQVDSIKAINENFGVQKKNICCVNPFTAIKPEKIPQTNNISFIGTKFGEFYLSTVYNKFMQSNPSEDEIFQFKQVEKSIIQNPFITKEELIEKLNLKSDKVIKNIDIENFIFILSSKKRIQTLSQIADLGLDLYGNINWINDLIYEPELVLCYKAKKVYSIKHNQDIYNSSKLCININHIQATTGFSWRVCDIMASNGCLISEFSPDFKRLFPNISIPTFTNRYEAREQCIKLLNNENMRKDIVAQCQDAIDETFRFTHLLKTIEEFLGMRLRFNSDLIELNRN